MLILKSFSDHLIIFKFLLQWIYDVVVDTVVVSSWSVICRHILMGICFLSPTSLP